MKSIEYLVFQLLQNHPCIIIPSFGGFVVKTKSARIDFEKGIATPPYKELSFNLKLNDNDGQLIKFCCLENNLSYFESETMVQENVALWNQNIAQGNKLHLENIGYFWNDQEGNVQFEQDRTFNLLLSSYGLEMIEFIPAIQKHSNEFPLTKPIKEKKNRLIKYAAAAAIAFPIAFYSYWIPAKTPAFESGLISYHDFNPLKVRNKGLYKCSSLSMQVVEIPTFEIPMEEQALEKYAENPSSLNETKAPFIQTIIEPESFHLIAGCFAKIENASRYAAKLQSLGFETQILQQGILYKISIGSSFAEDSLKPILEKAKETSINCWTLK